MEASWLIAVLLAAMASFISNLGVTLQKLHHLRLAAVRSGGAGLAQPEARRSSSGSSLDSFGGGTGPLANYLQGQMWRIGLFLVFFGSLADFAALSFGPQSLVAPLGSLTLVSNVIFAPLLLRETVGRRDVLATALIVIGSSVAVIFGSHEAVTYSVFQLFGFFLQWDFVLYALLITLYAGLLYMSIQKIERIERDDGVHSPRYAHYRALHRFAYPALSGTVGAQSVLFAKCVVELLANTVRHWQGSGGNEAVPATDNTPLGPFYNDSSSSSSTGMFNATDLFAPSSPLALYTTTPDSGTADRPMFLYWQTYFVFAAMLGAITAQIRYLNDGLKRFDASYAVPVFTSHWIILSVVSGMIFYREYTGMDSMQCLLFAVGVSITVGGVIALGGREQSHASLHHLPLSQIELDQDGGLANGMEHDDELELDEFSADDTNSTEPLEPQRHEQHSGAHGGDSHPDADEVSFGGGSASNGHARRGPHALTTLDVEMAELNASAAHDSSSTGSGRNIASSIPTPSGSSGGQRGHRHTPSSGSGGVIRTPSSSHRGSLSAASAAMPDGEQWSLATGAKEFMVEAGLDAAHTIQHAVQKLRHSSPYGVSSPSYANAISNTSSPRAQAQAQANMPVAAVVSPHTLSSRAREQHQPAAHLLEEGRLESTQHEDSAADTLIQALKE